MSKQPGMRRRNPVMNSVAFTAMFLAFCATVTVAQPTLDLTGTWSLIEEKSSDVDPWRSMSMTIESSDHHLTIFRDLIAGRDSRKDTLIVSTDGQTISRVVPASTKWLEQPHIGVFFDGKTSQHVSGTWLRAGMELMITISTTLQTSQAASQVDSIRRYILSEDRTELTLIETRSSRPRPIILVFNRQ